MTPKLIRCILWAVGSDCFPLTLLVASISFPLLLIFCVSRDPIVLSEEFEDELTPLEVLSASFPPLINTSHSPSFCRALQNRSTALGREWISYDNITLNQVMVSNLSQLHNLTERRHIDYNCMIGCTITLVRPLVHFTNPVDFNVFIPMGSKRAFNTLWCLHYLKQASLKSNYTIRIVLIETNPLPTLMQFTEEIGVDYLFLSNDISHLNGFFGLFPKSLLYNIAFSYFPTVPWYIFHDVDIIVPNDFFIKIQTFMTTSPQVQWFVPYNSLASVPRQQAHSFTFTSADKTINGINVGGSIAISSNLFREIGGYDPEIFCGWSPEDIFIVHKLNFNQLVRVPQMLGHIQHEDTHMKDMYTRVDDQILHCYKRLTDEERREYKALKQRLLKKSIGCDLLEDFEKGKAIEMVEYV